MEKVLLAGIAWFVLSMPIGVAVGRWIRRSAAWRTPSASGTS
ncbi:MAG TPA: hypothetical protein VNP94_06275 [Actinomycetota bacterium]|nr:hypothetical protein [Actinomycetota bacterium]